MKTAKQINKRIEIIEERLARLKEEKKQALTKVSDTIKESANDPMYVAQHINSWTAGITNLTDRIEKLEAELEIIKWVL